MPYVHDRRTTLWSVQRSRAARRAQSPRKTRNIKALPTAAYQTAAEFEALEPRVLFHATGLNFDPVIDAHSLEYNEAAEVVDVSTTQPLATLSLSDTFALHSNPGANQTIYLDFTGHTTQNTAWNSYAGVSNIVTPAYDIDGDTLNFSNEELTRIQYIFQRVAEDFIPFDVNVTTEEPPLNDLIKSGSSDSKWGVRVAIGGSSNDWLGVSAGGVAYIGSFNWSNDSPVFVFENNLGNGSEKRVSEAASHEIGHALGLDHDGIGSQEYYTGHGTGATSWAPIMGVGYSKTVTQWSRGEYNNATTTEDDLSIITSNNGFGYRADDHGNNSGSATPLTLSGNTVTGAGIIERNTDDDVFSFNTDSGAISFDIQPIERGANLDIFAELLNSNGNVVVSSNPLDRLDATLNANVSAGTYYVRITGTGTGNPSTGYSDYGSLGQYTVTGQLVEASPTISVDDLSVNEADGTAVFTVRLSAASSGMVTVNAATANGTATAGNDYTLLNQTLTFNPGETVKSVFVSITDDNVTESNESFSLQLSGVIGDATIGDSTGMATITDNDATVSVTVDDISVNEADGIAVFTVRLSQASSGMVTVSAATANDTATAGSDYTLLNQTLTFNPGEIMKSVSVSITDDNVTESNESFLLQLGNVTGNATIDDNTGVATITDNDAPVNDITVSINDVSVNEGNPFKGKKAGPKSTDLTFTVNLSDPSSQTVTVQYDTANDTAIGGNSITDGSDYLTASGSITFSPGQTSKTITLTVVGDGDIEEDETFFLNLLSASNATIADSQGIGTIVNDDGGKGGGKGGGNGKPSNAAIKLAQSSESTTSHGFQVSNLFSSYAFANRGGESSLPTQASFGFNLRDIFQNE